MGLKRTDEFRQDAVRIALTSGLTRKQVADDLGVGMSTLNKWITAHRDTGVVSKEDLSLAQENDRLRRENRLLKEERDILKKATQFFAGLKQCGLGSSRNTGPAFQPIGCVRSLASVHAAYGHSAAVLPAADSDLTWSRWHISRSSRVLVLAATADHA
jgi:transposase